MENVDLNSINVDELEENRKKDLIKKAEIYIINNFYEGNYQDFNEILEEFFDGVEQGYWDAIGDIDSYLKESINRIIESGEESLPSYTIINRDGEVSDTYIAFANGKYTFTIKEIDTGKTYQGSIDVTNIDTNLEYYYVYGDNYNDVFLLDKTNKSVEFQNAYVAYNGERIDITSCIEKDNERFWINTADVAITLENMGKIEDYNELVRYETNF